MINETRCGISWLEKRKTGTRESQLVLRDKKPGKTSAWALDRRPS